MIRLSMWWLALLMPFLVATVGCARRGKGDPDAPYLEALESYHPTVKRDDTGRVIELRIEGKHVDDRALEEIEHLTALRVLSLYGASISDNALAKLKDLRYLEALGLGKTPITDQGLVYLEKLPSLRWLWLTENKKITPARVESLKRRALPGLTVYR